MFSKPGDAELNKPDRSDSYCDEPDDDLHRAFTTLKADWLSADSLQALLQHCTYQTMQRYIKMARQFNQAVDGLFVPDVAKASATG